MQPNRLLTIAFAATLALAPALAWAGDLQVAGIPNFYKVNDHIYRGAQPSGAAWPELAKLGVKTVIDLRREGEHSTDAESKAVTAAGMRYVNFPMNGFDTPTSDQMAKVLALLDGNDPVFIHCKLGKDRTGTVVAAYRIAREKWENPKAMAEAESCGLHWYEKGMKRFIAGYRCEPSTLASAGGGATGSGNAAGTTAENAAASPAR